MSKPNAKYIEHDIVLGLLAVVLIAFSRALSCGFVFDDGDYLIRNPMVHLGLSRAGLIWALKTTHMGNWHPITWYSHMLDAELFGPRPWGHHLTNLVIHAANTLLLYLLMRFLTGRVLTSAVVAALFAIHPLHVESVAWISERKGLLSTFFSLLAMLAYVWHVRVKMVSPVLARRIYLLVVVLFILALMCKPMAVTLPFVLVLLDYWPLGITSSGIRGWVKQIAGKHVLLILSAVSCFITLIAQRNVGALTSGAKFTFAERLANAAVSYVTYVVKTIWPTALCGYYPHLGGRLPLWQGVASGIIVVAVSILVVKLARLGKPYLAVGWFWYLGTLVPVIGLVQVGWQARADRYTYLPLIGLFIVGVFGGVDLLSYGRGRKWIQTTWLPEAMAAIVVGALAICTWVQVGYWHDQETFWNRAIAVTRGNYIAHYNLGCFLANSERTDEALDHFRAAIRAASHYPEAHNNLGVLLAARGSTNEARQHYLAAIRQDPNYADPHINIADLLADEANLRSAIDHYKRALEIAPDRADANYGIGEAMSRMGKYTEALRYYRAALRSRPNYPEAHESMARALYKLRRYSDALEEVERAQRLGASVDAELLEALERMKRRHSE